MTVTTFIYALCDPDTKIIRYVGKSDFPKRRIRNHLSTKAKTEKAFWIRGLLADKKRPYLEILDEVPSAEWEFWEREYISLFKILGMPLLNENSGGAGPSFLSSESREKISKSNKRNPKIIAARALQVLTPERNRKISITSMGAKRSNNKSGHVGVCWHTKAKKWSVEIKILKNKFYLGLFSSVEDAANARKIAENNYRERGVLPCLG